MAGRSLPTPPPSGSPPREVSHLGSAAPVGLVTALLLHGAICDATLWCMGWCSPAATTSIGGGNDGDVIPGARILAWPLPLPPWRHLPVVMLDQGAVDERAVPPGCAGQLCGFPTLCV